MTFDFQLRQQAAAAAPLVFVELAPTLSVAKLAEEASAPPSCVVVSSFWSYRSVALVQVIFPVVVVTADHPAIITPRAGTAIDMLAGCAALTCVA